MLRHLDQAYDIMRELEDMSENIETRAEQLFDSYHLLSGATDLSIEFLKYRQNLMNTIVKYREEVMDYIKLLPIQLADQNIYSWAKKERMSGEDNELRYVSMDILHTKVWDLLGMEDVPMEHESKIGATCLFNGIQATIDDTTKRRKFAGRVVFGDLTVRHVLFDIDGKVVSLGYIDHEHDNRDDPSWSGPNHELVFVREDCVLLKQGSDVWYKGSRYRIVSLGSDEHLTPRGYVNKEKLTNIRLHLQPEDTTRKIEVVITGEEVRDVRLRGHETSKTFTVDLSNRLMYENGYVCDHLFQKREADMICSSLGYEDVLSYTTGYEIPPANAWGRPHITMTDLDCNFMAQGLDDCKRKFREDMDQQPSLWGFCGTQNGVQLKCVNNWKATNTAFRTEIEAMDVSCSRDETSLGDMFDTAQECSGGKGDQASDFGNVEKVIVEGPICVKLIRENKLDCVVNQADEVWDFTDLDILNRFCYSDSLSDKLLPFPEKIKMISEKRTETCVDDESSLQKADLHYIENESSEKILDCEVGRAKTLCNEYNQLEDGITIDEKTLGDFHEYCKLTCRLCSKKDIDYYMVTVNKEKATFALNSSGIGIPVTVTIGGAAETAADFYPESSATFSFDKKTKFQCGEKIQFAARADYEYGDVVCTVRMVDPDTSEARMVEASGEVIIGGDIEVTFDCHLVEERL